MSKKIAVIGCGAAGMMAALSAAQCGGSVTLFEKNEKPGKKIYITGKGRCNVTNACAVEDFFGFVKRNPRFLYSAVYDFDNTAVMEFFEDNGCHLKVERGDRVFPVSDHSSDIINTLYRAVQRAGVNIQLGATVHSVEAKDGSVSAVTYSSAGDNADDPLTREEFDSVIVCTGGLSYPSTGSTGDGYRFAKELGHGVNKAYPSLVPFEIKEPWVKELQGLSLRNVGLKLFLEKDSGKAAVNEAIKSSAYVNTKFVGDDNKLTGNDNKPAGDENASKKGTRKIKPVYDGFGEMLFTHFGVSGPLVLTASCLYDEGKKGRLLLDLKPALSEEQLDKRVLRDFEDGLNKQFKNILGGLFPNKLIPVMIKLSGIDPEKPVNEITREERISFVKLIKNVPMTITGTRNFNEAIITKGGVNVKEINPSTMESKLVKGLYFAGEVLDVDAETGGFNLQIAWSTGHLAGASAACE